MSESWLANRSSSSAVNAKRAMRATCATCSRDRLMAGQSSGRTEASALVFVDAGARPLELTGSYPSPGTEPNGNRDERKEDHPEQPENVHSLPAAPVPLVQRDEIDDRQ